MIRPCWTSARLSVSPVGWRLSFPHCWTAGAPSVPFPTSKCLGREDVDDIRRWNSAFAYGKRADSSTNVILEGGRDRQNKIAVDAWDGKLTYQELVVLSRCLASHLRSNHAIGRGSVVSILMPKSSYVAVAATAVLRAGATFVPLDVGQPSSRLKSVLDQIHHPSS